MLRGKWMSTHTLRPSVATYSLERLSSEVRKLPWTAYYLGSRILSEIAISFINGAVELLEEFGGCCRDCVESLRIRRAFEMRSNLTKCRSSTERELDSAVLPGDHTM
jgi:hypothetical protein